MGDKTNICSLMGIQISIKRVKDEVK